VGTSLGRGAGQQAAAQQRAARRRAGLAELEAEIVACRRCPRLVEWRERVAREKVARYADEPYWGRPLPGFGDPDARVLIVGLAPAAHGGNRTGRVFTGDRSGDFLWTALHATGFADRASSRRANDGLTLSDAWIAAAVRCAPPLNKPTNEERDTCGPYLVRELALLDQVRVIVPLGGFGWAVILRTLAALGYPVPRPRPRFGHGAEAEIGPYRLVASFHPSQQNTFTGRLDGAMLAAVMERARDLAGVLAAEPDRPTLNTT
jgi:uracil-DNA glycosylase